MICKTTVLIGMAAMLAAGGILHLYPATTAQHSDLPAIALNTGPDAGQIHQASFTDDDDDDHSSALGHIHNHLRHLHNHAHRHVHHLFGMLFHNQEEEETRATDGPVGMDIPSVDADAFRATDSFRGIDAAGVSDAGIDIDAPQGTDIPLVSDGFVADGDD